MLQRKFLASFLAVTVFLSGILFYIHAEEMNSPSADSGTSSGTPLSDFTYRLEHGGIYITGYHGNESDVQIAETYTVNGRERRVKGIDKSAFEANENLTSIILPSTIETIGDYAFYDCTNLTSVTLLSDNAVIGDQAFGYYYISYQTDGKVDGFVLSAHEGSTAEEYLAENGLSFSALTDSVEIGDLDADGEINSKDLVVLTAHLLGDSVLSEDNLMTADLNNDNEVNILDLIHLKKVLANQTEEPPVVDQ